MKIKLNIKNIIKADPLSLIAFFLPLSIYLYTAPHFVVGFGDSAEMVMSSYTFQAAHPPGYPLFILLGKLFTLLPFGTVAFRVSIMSSVITSLTVFFVYRTFKIFFVNEDRQANTSSSLFALTGSLFIAFFYSIWLYAIVPEVHALNNLLVSAIIYLSLKTVLEKKEDVKSLFVIFLLFGLGLSNHLTIILLLPPVLLFLLLNGYMRNMLSWKSSAVAVLCGLSLYIFVFIAAYFPHYPMYGNIPGVKRFIEYVLRSDYGGITSGGYKEPAQSNVFPLTTYFYLWKLIIKGYLYVPLLGALYVAINHIVTIVKYILSLGKEYKGIGNRVNKNITNEFFEYLKSPLSFLLNSTFLITCLFPVFSLWGLDAKDTHIRAVTEHFSLTEFLLVGMVTVIGSYRLINRALLKIKYFKERKVIIYFYPILMTVLFLMLIFFNFRDANKRDYTLMHNFAANMLGQIPDGSIIFASDDINSFLLIYLTRVEKVKPNVKIISNGFLTNVYYQKELKKEWPDLFDTDSVYSYDIARNIIEKNAEKGVYFATFDDPYPYGFLGNPDLLDPQGMLIYANPKTTKEDLVKGSGVNYWEKYNYEITTGLKGVVPSSDFDCLYRDQFTCLTLWNYYFKARINSQVYVNADCRECAEKQIDLAGGYINNREKLISDLESVHKEEVGSANDVKSLLSLAKSRFANGNPSQSDFFRTAWDLLRAEKLDPKNAEIEGGLGEIFEMLKVYPISYEKYKTAARLDPRGGWEEAMKRVQSLK